jgi:hypothetical protein
VGIGAAHRSWFPWDRGTLTEINSRNLSSVFAGTFSATC